MRGGGPLFHWDREAPEAFALRLDALWPSSGRAQWFVPVWSSGTPDDPIQRWVIYSATPANMLSDYEREEIEARNLEVLPPCVKAESPLAVARAVEMALEPVPYAECPMGRRRALAFWEVHRAMLLPVWVVQGENGGHAYRWTEHERRMLRLEGLPDDEPDPGSLPYHPLDERVIDRLVAMDRLRKVQVYGKHADRIEKDRQEREFREALWDLVDTSDYEMRHMAEVLDACGVVKRQEAGESPDDGAARYVETGTL